MSEAGPILHFLVIAAASRGARFFIKKALLQGHSVTALCRAEEDRVALKRIEACLADTVLLNGSIPPVYIQGTLHAGSRNILYSETYRSLFDEHSSSNRVCCFVGVTSVSQMMRRDEKLYNRTIQALVQGMHESCWVKFFIMVRRAAKAFQDKIHPNYQPTLGPNGS